MYRWTNDTFQPTDEEKRGAQANNQTLFHDLLVAQQNIRSLQERLLELQSEQGIMDGWIDEYHMRISERMTR